MGATFLAIILEPDPLTRDLMGLTLKNMACDVLVAADGGEARRLLRQRQADLLVLDTFLPNVNGLDLLRSFQTAHLLDKTSVVVVSAFGFEEVVRQAVLLGIGAYLVKPLDVQLFMTKVQALMSGKNRASAMEA
jgi:two-component system, response regulator, stage 0 sporulation protein A